jgi:hypothetical protein
MTATQLTDFGTDQSPMTTGHFSKIRTKWKAATTVKITPAIRENVFAPMSDPPSLSRIAVKQSANVQRTKWSPKWSRTRDHERVFNGTNPHAGAIFPKQINTYRHRKKGIGTPTNKF